MFDFAKMGAMFAEGLVSFFSPCVLPLIPVYFGYLSQDAKTVDDEGNVTYKRGKVFVTTIFFVLGICTVFFIMAAASTAFRRFFNDYAVLISFVGSFLLLIFGLLCLNVIQIPFLAKDHKLSVNLDLGKMNFLKAFIFGFLFSFSWTPCIGPALSSAMVLTTTAANTGLGFLYIAAYTIGFIIMFLLIGLFTEEVLNIIKKNKNITKYASKIGGILLVIMSIYMFIDASGKVISLQKGEIAATNGSGDTTVTTEEQTTTQTAAPTGTTDIETYSFTLNDTEGNVVTLSDYLGQPVVITFFRTWCPYCLQELTAIQNIQQNNPDVKFILITTPSDGQEVDEEGIVSYMNEHDFTTQLVYDRGALVMSTYGVSGFPTSFIFKADGSVLGYLPGYTDEAGFQAAIDQMNE